MTPKRRSAKQDKLPATPIDAQKRKLEEEERRLQEKMERCNELIQKAPEIKEQRTKLAREALIKARSRGADAIPSSRTALPDPRYRGEQVRARTATGPRLRSERAQGRALFFFLLAVLLGAMTWAYYYVMRG